MSQRSWRVVRSWPPLQFDGPSTIGSQLPLNLSASNSTVKSAVADVRETGLRGELSAGQMAMVAVGGSIGTGLLLGSGAAAQKRPGRRATQSRRRQPGSSSRWLRRPSRPRRPISTIIGAWLFGGMLAWWVALAAHVRFRARACRAKSVARLPMRSPGGALASQLGFVVLALAIASTWWVDQSRITIVSGGPYLLVLTAA